MSTLVCLYNIVSHISYRNTNIGFYIARSFTPNTLLSST